MRNCRIIKVFQCSFTSNSFRIRSCPDSDAEWFFRIPILLIVSDPDPNTQQCLKTLLIDYHGLTVKIKLQSALTFLDIGFCRLTCSSTSLPIKKLKLIELFIFRYNTLRPEGSTCCAHRETRRKGREVATTKSMAEGQRDDSGTAETMSHQHIYSANLKNHVNCGVDKKLKSSLDWVAPFWQDLLSNACRKSSWSAWDCSDLKELIQFSAQSEQSCSFFYV